jgi:UDP-N-acetylglucosamine 2-epimerase (non-hydrolysing)
MPEEINRIGSDHLSDLLFAPTEEAMRNLGNEGLSSRSILVGDVMVETLFHIREKISTNDLQKKQEIFATIHRAENTNSQERLSFIVKRLAKSPVPIQLRAHPRLLHKAENFGINLQQGSINVLEPANYFDTIKGIIESVGVITDSGGLQKEAYLLEKPCLTVREETEWQETLNGNWNFLDANLEKVNCEWWNGARPAVTKNIFGDGQASRRILEALTQY